MKDALLCVLGLIIVLRVTIWKLYTPSSQFVKEDFSNLIVAAAIIVPALVWIIHKIRKNEKIIKTGFEMPVFIFFAAALASLAYTSDVTSSFHSVCVLSSYIIFFFMLVDLLDSRKRIKYFISFLLICAAIVAACGLKDFVYLMSRPEVSSGMSDSLVYLLTRKRVTSFLGWPNTLAAYLLLFMPLAAACAFVTKNRFIRTFCITVFFLILACFFLTFSFMVWLNLILSFVMLMPFLLRMIKWNQWTERKRHLASGVLVIMILLFCAVILRKDFAASMTPRKIYYKAAFELIKEKPLLGHGWDTYGIRSKKFAYEKNALTAYVHNSYIQAWVEAGIAGLLGILLILWMLFYKMFQGLRKSWKDENERIIFFALSLGCLSFMIDNFFSFTFLKPNVSLHGWTMLAVFAAWLRQNEPETGKSLQRRRHFVRFGFFAAILFMGYFLFRMCGGFYHFEKGVSYFKNQNLKAASENMARAGAWDPWHARFRAGEGEMYVMGYASSKKDDFFKLAETKFWQAINLSPHNYGYYLLLSKLYERHGDLYKAQQMERQARHLSPYEFDRDEHAIARHKGGGE